jgi:hypothetical protein
MSDTLQEIILNAKLMYDINKKIQANNDANTLLQAQYRKIAQKELPRLFEQAGNLEDFTVEMDDGAKVLLVLSPNIHARLSEGSKDEVFAWMTENGYAHHIGNDVTVPFTKGQEQELEQFVDYLDNSPIPVQYGVERAVHSSTYTSFCKELVKDGWVIDDKVFGIHRAEEVTLCVPKVNTRNKKLK